MGGILRGLGAGISAGFGAVVIGISMALFPRPVGQGSDMPPNVMMNQEKGPRLDPESGEIVDEAIGETEREQVTSNGTIIDSVPGGDRDQADEDFDEMELDGVRSYDTGRGEVRSGTLPDGSRVTVRPSADGRPTIEISEQDSSGDIPRGRVREIRYGSKT